MAVTLLDRPIILILPVSCQGSLLTRQLTAAFLDIADDNPGVQQLPIQAIPLVVARMDLCYKTWSSSYVRVYANL